MEARTESVEFAEEIAEQFRRRAARERYLQVGLAVLWTAARIVLDALFFSFAAMLAWNISIAQLTALPVVTLLNMIGVYVLIKVLSFVVHQFRD
jgi:uncharacterized membrane protein YhaH (DUF805 family)